MSPAGRAEPARSEPRPVDVDAIERELEQLFRGHAEDSGEQAPLTRARMSNLLVFTSSAEQAEHLPDDIAEIVRLHPSRVLLLVGDAQQPRAEIEAFVSAQCHLGEAGRQICSEHVTLRASGEARPRLPSLARSLLVGELPTALWWTPAEPPSQAGEVFRQLADMAEEIVYDSAAWLQPQGGLSDTAAWARGAGGQSTLTDLAWRRLEPWRLLISQSLAPAVNPGALDSIAEVSVEHGRTAAAAAWMLVGWLASRLGWVARGGRRDEQGADLHFASREGELRVSIRSTGDAGDLGRACVSWKSPEQSVRAVFSRASPSRLAATIEPGTAPQGCLAAPPHSRGAILAGSLILGRDRIFLDALQAAASAIAAAGEAERQVVGLLSC